MALNFFTLLNIDAILKRVSPGLLYLVGRGVRAACDIGNERYPLWPQHSEELTKERNGYRQTEP